VRDILMSKGLQPDRVVVELNRRILTFAEFSSVNVQEGDTLEVLQFVGGG
jgi:thiamine biosynthesis protein ThiS